MSLAYIVILSIEARDASQTNSLFGTFGAAHRILLIFNGYKVDHVITARNAYLSALLRVAFKFVHATEAGCSVIPV